ncbi:2,3,4,5-tetrahydropyridine-2,6-dicarboxylate N-succinyltransferase [Algibacter lectus]|uniref:2,3,4,5-tetrahydropyridine-2,6-dicarboxylate N-succinyltransferase n=1 Tax=Algibacter lectus TaxID=221126 RepID=A0A090VDU9_9FLAO|nr:2,3,4,5-tetrahydropyridine-2,6-dicarboxylate N-succinyltransferase [Algibacter lectus]
MTQLQEIIEKAWENRDLLNEEATTTAIRKVVDLLDAGELRVAEPIEGGWQVNEWVKKAVVYISQFKKWKP